MFGLNGCQEMALSIVWMRQDDLPADFTDVGITKHLLVLRDSGMISMQTDMSHELAFVQALCPAGREHYSRVRQRRSKFKIVSDGADELINILCCNNNAKKKYADYLDRVDDYRELSRKGLIHVDWAGDVPYRVEITDDGREYFEGWFLNQEDSVNINMSPTINNNIINEPSSSSTSFSASSPVMDVSLAIKGLRELDLDSGTKGVLIDAIDELDSASKESDGHAFLDKLEKLSSIAKNVASAGKVVIPFISAAIQSYLGQ